MSSENKNIIPSLPLGGEDSGEEESIIIPPDDVVICVSNLSKCYQIYDQPHDRLKQSIYPPLRRLVGKQPKQYFREFWALKDVSFDIKKGETVGIIGRNGSGKSTLLQMLCGTLNPTCGSIQTRGRIAALLELGSGFNPEFTGRENVYMNAAIIGLSREQTEARFDDIVAFADIGDFMEQPVKTYSSGMYLRLAFAVIAHVDADILVIDEALAVGDAVFTQKCMRYIRAFQESGTLIFVSHDMGSVLNLCKTCIWLGHGMVQKTGTSKEVAEAYLQHTLQQDYGEAERLIPTASDNKLDLAECPPNLLDEPVLPLLDYQAKFNVQENMQHAKGWHTETAEIISIRLVGLDAGIEKVFQGGERVRVIIRAKAHQTLEQPILGFIVRDRLGQDLFGENTLSFSTGHPSPVHADQEFVGEFVFRLPMLPNGEYAVMASVADGDRHGNVQHHYLHDS
ncbi:MAG: ABC transporter ATP-binding protein, partial [Desulfobacteraceae bacterium]|nr:ABC transporter ATP-binding protein [Desulfobacteraceae bacterium]